MQTNSDIHTTPGVRRFRRWASVTLGAVVFLIWVGGLVRMTGSGMGCPDWPKCFGQWVPPTDISQLPADYKIRFQVAGKEIADFDAYKTWIEYLNRLVGVVIGLLCIGTFAFSIRIRRQYPSSFAFALATLVAVILQGGIGAIVVKTNLHVGLITVHMVIALLIAGLLVLAMSASYQRQPVKMERAQWIGLAFLVVAFAQIVMGTQVRESVDEIAIAYGEAQRDSWVDFLTPIYQVHKLFHYVVAAALLWWLVASKAFQQKNQRTLAFASVAALGAEVMLGLTMHHFGMPKWAQPFHLLVAVVLFLAGFALWMIQRYNWERAGVVTEGNLVRV